MFVEEKSFVDYLKRIKVEVDKITSHKIIFEEYVVVPYFGFIILRFNFNDDVVLNLYSKENGREAGLELVASYPIGGAVNALVFGLEVEIELPCQNTY